MIIIMIVVPGLLFGALFLPYGEQAVCGKRHSIYASVLRGLIIRPNDSHATRPAHRGATYCMNQSHPQNPSLAEDGLEILKDLFSCKTSACAAD